MASSEAYYCSVDAAKGILYCFCLPNRKYCIFCRTVSRNPSSPFHAIKTHDDWWNWTLTTLLDGLYWESWYNKASTNTKVHTRVNIPLCLLKGYCISPFTIGTIHLNLGHTCHFFWKQMTDLLSVTVWICVFMLVGMCTMINLNLQAGAVQGTCILIGEPTLKKIEKKSVCKVRIHDTMKMIKENSFSVYVQVDLHVSWCNETKRQSDL